MYFLITAPDRPEMLARRLELRQAHIDYWRVQAASVKVAGAMLAGEGVDASPVGSSFLLEAATEADARALIANDPFMIQGIFAEDFSLRIIRPALGEWLPKPA